VAVERCGDTRDDARFLLVDEIPSPSCWLSSARWFEGHDVFWVSSEGLAVRGSVCARPGLLLFWKACV
jgi:hypothetical protein